MANTRVTGRVVLAGSNPVQGIQGLAVEAFDIDPLTKDDHVGSDTTDQDGRFDISYPASKYRLWFPGAKPDIEVRIFGAGQRLLWETPKVDGVTDDTLVLDDIAIHANNLRIEDVKVNATVNEIKQDPYWLVTHTSLQPDNGQAVRLTRGNQLDWLVDGAVMFPAITDEVARGLAPVPGTRPTSIKVMNMGFDAKNLISKFDFKTKKPETVQSTDSVSVFRLGRILSKQAAAGTAVHVLMWELEEGIGGDLGGRLDKADDADEIRDFFKTSLVRLGVFKSTQLLHIKLVVVDGTTAFVVGSTLKQGYSGDGKHRLRDGRHGVPNPETQEGNRQLMHDVSLKAQGPCVRDIDQTFSTIWSAGDASPPAPAARTPPIGGPNAPTAVQVLRTLPGEVFTTPHANAELLPHGETGILESYQRAIMKAEEYIYIEDQYFNSRDVVNAIKSRLGEKPQLEVIIVVNARPDIGGYHGQQTGFINELRAAGGPRVGVFTMWSCEKTQAGLDVAHVYVHSKVAIVDSHWACVGTANVDGASLNHREWRVILPGLLEKVQDRNALTETIFVLLFPIILLVVFVVAPFLLMTQDIGGFVIDAIKREFVRLTQHANPNREQQPPRHPEINLTIFDGIAGEPPSGKVKELRDMLWEEHLGVAPPATRPQDGWVKHWDDAAKAYLDKIRDAAVKPSSIPNNTFDEKVLRWEPDRNYNAYLHERLAVLKSDSITLRASGKTMPFKFDEVHQP
jgi:phosphatidylserine/phosphatidylglycerophosphate/cardiolipin synthase-like enzyme